MIQLELKAARIQRAENARRAKSNTLVIQGHGLNVYRIHDDKARTRAVEEVFRIIGVELMGKFELGGTTPMIGKNNKNKPKDQIFPAIEAKFAGANLFDFLIFQTSYQSKLKQYHGHVRRSGENQPLYSIAENLPPLFQARNAYLVEVTKKMKASQYAPPDHQVDITRNFAVKIQDKRMDANQEKRIIPYWKVAKELAQFLPNRKMPE